MNQKVISGLVDSSPYEWGRSLAAGGPPDSLIFYFAYQLIHVPRLSFLRPWLSGRGGCSLWVLEDGWDEGRIKHNWNEKLTQTVMKIE